MPHYYALELYAPADSGEKSQLPSLSAETKTRLEEAGLAVNHGLLVGEILGIEVNQAIELLDEMQRAKRLFEDCYSNAESPPSMLYEEDITVLYETFTQVLAQLELAIDDEGQPKGTGGEQLLASELVGKDADGQLYLHSRHLELLRLKTDLKELCAFLESASVHHSLIKMEF